MLVSNVSARPWSGTSPLVSPAGNDLLMTVDISDDTMASTGTNKKITLSNLYKTGVSVYNIVLTNDIISAQSAYGTSTNKTFVIYESFTMSGSSTTITHDVFSQNGAIMSGDPTTGTTITFAGSFNAGSYQVFANDSSVTPVFGSGIEINPMWWGAGVGDTDDEIKINKAIWSASLGDNRGTVKLSGVTYIFSDSIILYNSVNFIGAGRKNTILDYRGSVDSIVWAERPSYTTISDFTLTHRNNINSGTSIAGIRTEYGMRYSSIKNIDILALDGLTQYGLLLQGDAVTAGVGVYNNYIELVNVFKDARRDDASVAFYLKGRVTPASGANVNTLIRLHTVDFNTSYQIDDGHGNTFIGCKTEDDGTEQTLVDHHIKLRSMRTAAQVPNTYDNTFIGHSFDNADDDKRVLLHNEFSALNFNYANFYGARQFLPKLQVDITSGSTGIGIPGFSSNSRGIFVSGSGVTNPVSTGTQQIVGQADGGILSIRGGPDYDSGSIILGSANLPTDINSVTVGGVAVVLKRNETNAQFNILSSTGNGTYIRHFTVSELGLMRLKNVSTLTISSGVVSVTSSFHGIATEDGAASDNLATINATVVDTSGILIIRAASGASTVVVKDNSGNLDLNGDFSMDDARDMMMLISVDGVSWTELSRSDNN